jgi:endoglycosylceramidase
MRSPTPRLAASLALVAASIALGCSSSEPAAPSTSSDAGAADPRAGTWHVARGALRDPEGRAAILRGANFCGNHKYPPYFGAQTAADVKTMRDVFGMNSARFLVLWAAIEPKKGEYDDKYLDAVAERVAWFEALGMTVVLDLHQDLYGEGFGGDGAPRWTCSEERYKAFKPASQWFLSYGDPNLTACFDDFWADTGADGLQAHYTEAARRLAKRLAGSKAVIGIDPMNEPYWGTQTAFETSRLVPFYARVMEAVRKEAPLWIAFAEPSAQHNLGVPTAIEAFPFAEVAFAPHAYDATAEQGQGFAPAGHDVFAQRIASYADEAKALGAALWIGEYGGRQNAGYASYMDAAYAGAGSVAASTMVWSYDYNTSGYGLMNDDGSEKPATVAALALPYPSRVAGDPASYAWDDAKKVFTARFASDATITAPTEIVVPKRAYPGGFAVTCAGCTTEEADGLVRVTKAPADEVTITIAPK